MNRKSFLKSLGALALAPFIAKGVTTVDVLPKAVQKQTVVEQKKLEKFYSPPKNYGYSGVFMVSGVMPTTSITGSYLL